MSTETLPSLSELRAKRQQEHATKVEAPVAAKTQEPSTPSPVNLEKLALSGNLMQKRQERQAAQQDQGEGRGQGQSQEQARPDLAPGAGLFMGARKMSR